MKTKIRFTLLAAVAAGAMALTGTPAQAGDNYRHHYYNRGYTHVYYGGGGYYGGTRYYTSSPYYYSDYYYRPVYYAPTPTVYLPPLPFIRVAIGD